MLWIRCIDADLLCHLSLESAEELGAGQAGFRIAESSPDFSQTILSSGRFVTHGIQFDVNSDRLKAESMPVLKMVADAVAANPSLKLRIEGHTDSSGDPAKNLDLSKRRAAAGRHPHHFRRHSPDAPPG